MFVLCSFLQYTRLALTSHTLICRFGCPFQASWWSLKKQFKSVFHNVSTVLDCVSCQKCRLHAKVTMLGLGAALKMLLLPHELIQVKYIHIYTYIYIYIYMQNTHAHPRTHPHTHTHPYMYIYIYVHVCIAYPARQCHNAGIGCCA